MPATAEDLYLEYRKNPVPTPWEEVEQTPAEEVVALWFPPGIEAPPAPLEHLAHVRALTLTGEPRKAVPSWVFDLPSLERLRLTGLGLKRLPARLEEIAPRLVHLDVWGNDLTALPDWMEQFERLRSLHVGKNTWSRVSPEDWGALPALECFNLENTRLTALPAAIGTTATSVRCLMVHMASKISELPESLGSCTGLRVLSVDQCRKLKALPDTRFEHLESLVVTDTRVKSIPEGYWSPTLQHVCVEPLKSIPEALRNARSLTHLDIRFSRVEELPEWLADLPALELVWHPGVKVPPGLESVATVG